MKLLSRHYTLYTCPYVQGSEPRLTNYDDYDSHHPADWCLDYISYSRETLRPVAVLETVSRKECTTAC